MTYLDTVAKECMYKLEKINIPYNTNVDFNVNPRFVKWGQCAKRVDGYHISVNKVLADGNHKDGLVNTLIHELLHTCPGCMNHGSTWKRYAGMVNNTYGISITRTNSAEEKGVDPEEVRKEKPKYKFKCEK